MTIKLPWKSSSKFTIDTPCNHENGKLPVLDVMVNVNEEENYRIDYEHFEKETKHPKLS